MEIREQLQNKFVEDWLNSSRRAILKLAPRFGKTRCALLIVQKLNAKKILVVYPRKDIQSSWEKEITLLRINVEVHYTTYRSLHKRVENYDLTIYDEQHEASDNNLEEIAQRKGDCIGLTGTMTRTTERNILEKTGIYVCSEYSIEEGVGDGVICDYEINVHKIPLIGTERARFSSIIRRMQKAKGTYQNMLKLQAIGILQKSQSKIEYTKKLIKEHENERLLIFCGQTEVADQLGVDVYHSKKREKELFDKFCDGEGKHMACVKLLQAGITIKPINRAIINYTSGASEDCAQKICRLLGKEMYDKKAYIEFLSIDEEFDQQRVKTALQFFDKNKIYGL